MECLFFSVTGEKMKRILINKSLTDEIRVALVEGAKLYDLDTKRVIKTYSKEVFLRLGFLGLKLA